MNPKSKVARLARALQDILGLSADEAAHYAWELWFDLAVERARGAQQATSREVTEHANAA